MQKIYFFNSLTRQKEEFKTIDPENKKVSIYTCGPTVYDLSHLGHARSFMAWDLLVRFLRFSEYEVTWVRNLTDVDDKIIQRAEELNIHPDRLARRETLNFWIDMKFLKIQEPDFEPRATDHIPQIETFIDELIKKGFAYLTEAGDVYFSVKQLESYGKLKNLQKSELESICRIEHKKEKKDQCDFALWKACVKEEFGFQTNFGYGRPGWHVECSAMIKKYLGRTIDIHTGGEDLQFPHHENEIAQSESLHDQKFVNYWLHNGMIKINGQKMSKSLNNFVTIRDLSEKFSPNGIRFFLLSTNYRQAINFTEEALESAEKGFLNLEKEIYAQENLELLSKEEFVKDPFGKKFLDYLSDDLNSSCALSVCFDLIKNLKNTRADLATQNKKKRILLTGLNVLGFDLTPKKKSENSSQTKDPKELLKILVEVRTEAKKKKDFALSDLIRDQLKASGYELKDLATGETEVSCIK